jgi:hypothetical protein
MLFPKSLGRRLLAPSLLIALASTVTCSRAQGDDSVQPLVQAPAAVPAPPAPGAAPAPAPAAVAAPAPEANWVSPAPAPCAPPACGTGNSCGCGTSGSWEEPCGDGRLFGLFAPSDTCFSQFVSPISNPLYFEDPRALTEVRPIYAHHTIPGSNPVFNGGQAEYFAVQVRAALSERLSIVANKDGYIWLDSNNEPAVPDTNGWANIAAGLKYALVRDVETQTLVSAGLIYEVDTGSHKVFQGTGNGEFHPFLSAGWGPTEDLNLLTSSGFRLPTDNSSGSQMWYWSSHASYQIVENWYGLVELNWFHWMSSGRDLPVGFEGGDLLNLGATPVAGNDIVTMAFGGKKRFGKMNELGVGYEIPLTDRRDILQSRLYADVIFRF